MNIDILKNDDALVYWPGVVNQCTQSFGVCGPTECGCVSLKIDLDENVHHRSLV